MGFLACHMAFLHPSDCTLVYIKSPDPHTLLNHSPRSMRTVLVLEQTLSCSQSGGEGRTPGQPQWLAATWHSLPETLLEATQERGRLWPRASPSWPSCSLPQAGALRPWLRGGICGNGPWALWKVSYLPPSSFAQLHESSESPGDSPLWLFCPLSGPGGKGH